MCGVGGILVTVECSKVDGPTDAPITTEVGRVDRQALLCPSTLPYFMLRRHARMCGTTVINLWSKTWRRTPATQTESGQTALGAAASAQVWCETGCHITVILSQTCFLIPRNDPRRLVDLLQHVE